MCSDQFWLWNNLSIKEKRGERERTKVLFVERATKYIAGAIVYIRENVQEQWNEPNAQVYGLWFINFSHENEMIS